MESFDDRIAASRAAETAETARLADAESAAALAEAKARAQQIPPQVEAAIGAVQALPLPRPYEATELEWKVRRRGRLVKDTGHHYDASVRSEFKKRRFGKRGIVTSNGYVISVLHDGLHTHASLFVDIRPDRPVRFQVRGTTNADDRDLDLDQLCAAGVVSWSRVEVKDSYTGAGSVPASDLLDTFVSVAAKLVAKIETT